MKKEKCRRSMKGTARERERGSRIREDESGKRE
jgi:hypothetical protein